MAINKQTTQGQSYTLSPETALGTAAVGGAKYFRPETFDLPTQTAQAFVPESGGHINPANTNKAIPFKDGSGTGSISMLVRRATTTLEPSVGIMLKAGGWTQAKLTGATTVKTATEVDDLIFTADVAAENGSFVLVETTDDRFELVHIAAWTAAGTHGVPVFDMSADPTDLDAIEQAFTYYPQTGTLGATEGVTFVHQSRVTDGADVQEWTHGGCACILKTITIEPNKPWMFEFEVLVANTASADGTWVAETDHEVVGVAMVNNDFEFLLEDANALGAGGIARTSMGIRKVTIDTGVTAEKITSVGGSTDLNSVGGYSIKTVPPTWTVDGWFDASRVADWQTGFISGTGTNPDVALMASSATQDQALYPACAVSSPRCNLIECPTTTLEGTDSGLVEMTLMFRANDAILATADARATLGNATDAGNQAIYIGISGTGA